MTPTSNRLLGNNGPPQALFATVREFNHPSTLLQWLNKGPLHQICICFCLDGTIPIAFFSVSGPVHNSQVAEFGNIYGKLEDVSSQQGQSVASTLPLET